jgi:soluble lytic murein transglycosylase
LFHYLYSAGDPERALEELSNAQGLIPKRAASLTEESARLTLLAARCGEYRLVTRLMNSYTTGTSRPINSRWNHPLVYSRELSLAYRRYNLPPQLVLSVIRTESAFQKDAVSASNARGLMQLLPSTAENVAGLLGEPEVKEEELFEVETNIRYGTYYLYRLIDAFDSVPMALAAYNGGPFNMVSLIATRGNISMDLFVETLPFTETSNYVRRVLESVYSYELAYMGTASYPDLSKKVMPPRNDPPPF